MIVRQPQTEAQPEREARRECVRDHPAWRREVTEHEDFCAAVWAEDLMAKILGYQGDMTLGFALSSAAAPCTVVVAIMGNDGRSLPPLLPQPNQPTRLRDVSGQEWSVPLQGLCFVRDLERVYMSASGWLEHVPRVLQGSLHFLQAGRALGYSKEVVDLGEGDIVFQWWLLRAGCGDRFLVSRSSPPEVSLSTGE